MCLIDGKISTVCLGENGPVLKIREIFTEAANMKCLVISSNFGNELQMMVTIGKEYGFTSNFDILWPFTRRKTELPRKMANCRTASAIPV